MQAEDREVAERADRTILILGAERVGGILDDGEAAVSRLGLNRREITGLTRKVDRDDRLRTWRDPRREQGGVQVQGIAADIPEYGTAPEVEHRVRSGDKRQGRGNGLVTGADPSGEARGVQSRGS